MNPDDSQTPEQNLEKAFVAESETDSQQDDAAQPVEEENMEPAEPSPPVKNLNPLPELTLGNSEPENAAETEPAVPVNDEPELEISAAGESDGEREDSPDKPGDIAALQQQRQELEREIQTLKAQKSQILAEQMAEAQGMMGRLVQEGLRELEQRKKGLQTSIEQLERRRDRIREEMRTSFAGVSQDMAIRVQGFKDYLVGSLQDLAAAAEQLELPAFEPREQPIEEVRSRSSRRDEAPTPRFAKQSFQEQRQQISTLLEQYRTRPDYYGPPWQLRRTFEPIHAERVQKWFYSQGGRGAIPSMGSRLQNILIASSAISVMRNLYSDRLRALVLANTPERLGEWRRGLQDCLGISRSDFGPSRGVTLFESPEALVQKAERLVDGKQLPLIVIDETEAQIDLSLLQFPLWLAFAPDPNQPNSYPY